MAFDIKKNLKMLPDKPGVYLHKDALGHVIYVGKAVSLKNRVRQYFQSQTNMAPKVRAMVSHIEEFEYITTDSEMEALILECNLIKKYMPKYNVLLRDDKTYPYIKVTLADDYPRIVKTRRVVDDGSAYFGPYSDVGAVNEIIDLLNSVYTLKRCSAKAFPENFRPCLNYHINQCKGICTGNVSKAEYRETIELVIDFLKGRDKLLLDMLTEKMTQASDALDYERAAEYRDHIISVKAITQKQKVVLGSASDMDMILAAKSKSGYHIILFYVRQGKLSGRDSFHMEAFDTEEESYADVISAFIKQYYNQNMLIPKEIGVEYEPADVDVLSEWLTSLRGAGVKVYVPQKGEKHGLMEMARRDVIEMMKVLDDRAAAKDERMSAVSRELDKIFGQKLMRMRAQRALQKGDTALADSGAPASLQGAADGPDAGDPTPVRADSTATQAAYATPAHAYAAPSAADCAQEAALAGDPTLVCADSAATQAAYATPANAYAAPCAADCAQEAALAGDPTPVCADSAATQAAYATPAHSYAAPCAADSAQEAALAGDPTLVCADSAATQAAYATPAHSYAAPCAADCAQEAALAGAPTRSIGGADSLDSPVTWRIESYDISNIAGVDSVGGMVVFENGRPERKSYRKFKIRTVDGPDDYSSMQEVIYRRFRRAQKGDAGFEKRPDLIFVDGGIGHVHAVEEVLAAMKEHVIVAGMVKDDRHRTRGLIVDDEEIDLKETPVLFRYVTTIQDEVHRFAIGYHHNIRNKSMSRSLLDDAPGIGERRKKELMQRFGSIENMRKATIEELANTNAMTLRAAEELKAYLAKTAPEVKTR